MNLTSIDKHLLAIEKLLHHPQIDANEVLRHLYYVSSFPLLIFTIPAGTHVYRASSSFKNEYFTQISRICHPPGNAVKSYGRANIPRQSMFYCSEDQATPYLELINYWVKNVSVGELFHVTIGEWEVVKDVEAIVVVSSDNAQRKSQMEIHSGHAFDNHLANMHKEQQKISNLVYGKFHDWYSRPASVGNDIYKVTSSITNKLVNAAKHLRKLRGAAVMYPSVANFEGGVNFAFEPAIVESGDLKLIRTWRIKIIAKANVEGFYNFTEVGREYGTIHQDGLLTW
ncbi:hypothetical protein PZB74_01935 [Porifericola rhodea]|uniref:hypothetical protein n=1 Tax=Porifericola rhodea TaxID=930972 RepID=UPI002666237B|nr:hypothetical protein [Porifericola rhodea]WKN32112.1 hypothetical protein PZB74_01935 [Porifericola rhodea]